MSRNQQRLLVINESPNMLLVVCEIANKPVRVTFDRILGSVEVHADDLAFALGYRDTQEAMTDDRFIDFINGIKSRTGEFPLRRLFAEKSFSQWRLIINHKKRRNAKTKVYSAGISKGD